MAKHYASTPSEAVSCVTNAASGDIIVLRSIGLLEAAQTAAVMQKRFDITIQFADGDNERKSGD